MVAPLRWLNCVLQVKAKFQVAKPGARGHKNRMKSLTEHLWFETPHRRDYLNITSTVEGLVSKSGVQEGLCLVNAMHITTCVAILPPAN